MDGWIVLGEFYVRPIDWEEIDVIEPEGVQYAAYRHHIMPGERVLIGTAPSPAAAARLITNARERHASGHDPRERRQQAFGR